VQKDMDGEKMTKKKISIRKPDKFGDWWVTIGGKPYEFARTKVGAKKIVDKIRGK